MRVSALAFGTRLCPSYARGLKGGGAGRPLVLGQCHRPFTTLLFILTSRCCCAHWVYDRYSRFPTLADWARVLLEVRDDRP